MNAHLLRDEGLKSKLTEDCATHARVVREVIDAHLAGQLEDTVALRTCALELHSLNGVASVLGFHAVASLISGLCEPMLARKRPEGSVFWEDFHRFFVASVACIEVCAEGRKDQASLDAALAIRERLLIGLGVARRASQPGMDAATSRALSPSAGRRLLLIDDSATVRAALSARLTDRGYPVRAARSMTETARLIEEFDPEIVVTDVCMPNVEGDELCRRIKAHMTRAVPVLLYSSLPEADLAERARVAGADGYSCKINGIEALIERMDEILSGESAS